MQPNRNDNTKVLIGLGFVAVFALMLLVTWLSMTSLQGVNSGMSKLIDDTGQKTSSAYQMRDVIRLRSGTARALTQDMTRVEQQQAFERLNDYTTIYQLSRDELVGLGANAREQAVLGEIHDAEDSISAAYDRAREIIFSETLDNDLLLSLIHI